ncbi:hypothetical protein [Streptomyces sp. NPDC021622]|uniref:hypothetical protein n=1 Tax=Streptomyces sp. NPDC021622 TaxID=3155013 RepID=UPI00340CD86D
MGVPESSQLPQTYTLFTPASATSPKICRDFVRSALETLGLGHLAESAALPLKTPVGGGCFS